MKPRSFIKQVNVCTLNLHKKDQFRLELIFIEAWRRPTLTGGNPQLPSALKSLTSVFGMGTGVTSSLSPPNLMERMFSQN